MDKVQCIVVGAGPAGSGCAYALAKKGIEVVLLERGRTPGEKNVASFVILTPVLEYIIPDYRDRAPLERNITRADTVFIGKNDVKVFQDQSYSYLDKPVCFSAFRGKFDAWLANEAKNAGAELLTGMTVTDLIFDNDRVAGVKIGEEELYADVVVGADGLHSIVAEKSGLIKERDLTRCYLGVKEVLDLPQDVINQRFQVRNGEGCTKEGFFTADAHTSFSLYTNTNSVSLAVFEEINELKKTKIKLHEHLEILKRHPYMHSLLEGASLREYQSHILSAGNLLKSESVYGDGVLLCGEAGKLMDKEGVGVPTGILSGMMAAETIEMAVQKNDYSARTLKHYINYLDTTSLWRTMYEETNLMGFLYAVMGEKKSIKYQEKIAAIMEKNSRNYVNYVSRDPYPFWKNMYMQVGKNFTPFFIRWIITGWVRLSLLYSSLCHKLKKKYRLSYYKWKKNYESRQ